jgi:hypothetical protein
MELRRVSMAIALMALVVRYSSTDLINKYIPQLVVNQSLRSCKWLLGPDFPRRVICRQRYAELNLRYFSVQQASHFPFLLVLKLV